MRPVSVPRGRLAATLSTALLASALLVATPGTATADATSTTGSTAPTGSAALVGRVSAAPARPADGTIDHTFVSSPDLFNADLASVRRIAPRARVDSWNAAYARAVDVVLDAMADERPDDVLVAGDLVEGHWGIDDAGTGIFGRITDDASARRAVGRAARHYYGHWQRRFDRRGLDVHVAVGDHEIGDDPWTGRSQRFKRETVGLRKRLFARQLVAPHRYRLHPSGPASRTAYATYVDPEVLVVTLDEFEQGARGVRRRLDRQQLAWLDRVLERAQERGTDWTIVQGHMPVLGPVRSKGSSRLFVEGRERSPLWRTLTRHRVDLYLAGEVHAVTARTSGPVTQITHGGLFGFGLTNYLVGQVDGDTMELELKDFQATVGRSGPRLWATDTRKGPPARLTYRPGPLTRGTMSLRSDNQVLTRTGLLAPYRG